MPPSTSRRAEDGAVVIPFQALESMVDTTRIVELERIDVESLPNKATYRAVKRALDIILCIVALAVLAIPMMVVGILVKLDSPGPVFYTQERLGRGGKPFRIVKFRTMVEDAEAGGGAVWAEEDDPRTTRMGRPLRRTRFDEVPQFFNVIKGDMSLIGPRPERPVFYDQLERYIHGFRQRILVKPGVSGLAQVNGYYLLPEDKVLYDLEYIKTRSLALDARLVLRTLKVLVTGESISKNQVNDATLTFGQEACTTAAASAGIGDGHRGSGTRGPGAGSVASSKEPRATGASVLSDRFPIPQSGLCLVSFSHNADHQRTLYSMFNELRDTHVVVSVGASNVKTSNMPGTARNLLVDCPARPGIAKGTFRLAALREAADFVRRSGCRTVYFESVHVWNLLLVRMLGRGFTFVGTIHDVVPHDGQRSVLYFQKLQTRMCDYLVVKNAHCVDDAARLYRPGAGRMAVLEVWRDFPPFDPRHKRSGTFLFFGRMKRYKGVGAISAIVQALPDVRFTVMGAPDEQTKEQVLALGRFPNVELVAREATEAEMQEALACADWVLLPYKSATQSGVIIDASRFGTPAIAFGVGGVAGQVADGTSGFLVPAEDTSDFVKAVRRASCMPNSDYACMRRAAYDFGASRHASAVAARRLVALCNVEPKGVQEP